MPSPGPGHDHLRRRVRVRRHRGALGDAAAVTAYRAFVAPFLVAVSVVGVLCAIVYAYTFLCPGSPHIVELSDHLQVLMWQTSVTIVVPLILLALDALRRWKELVVVRQVLQLTSPASAESVRTALRTTLGDPSLDVVLWLPERSRYIRPEGRLLPAGWDIDRSVGGELARWTYEVTTRQRERLAVFDIDGSLRAHGPLVEAAVAAASRALETAQVQASSMEQIRQAQQRIVRTEATERLELERNLHDGVQQHLLAICAQLGVLEADGGRRATPERIRGCREELLGALGELRLLAQGIHPPVLTYQGLGPALEVVSERLGTRITHRLREVQWSV